MHTVTQATWMKIFVNISRNVAGIRWSQTTSSVMASASSFTISRVICTGGRSNQQVGMSTQEDCTIEAFGPHFLTNGTHGSFAQTKQTLHTVQCGAHMITGKIEGAANNDILQDSWSMAVVTRGRSIGTIISSKWFRSPLSALVSSFSQPHCKLVNCNFEVIIQVI